MGKIKIFGHNKSLKSAFQTRNPLCPLKNDVLFFWLCKRSTREMYIMAELCLLVEIYVHHLGLRRSGRVLVSFWFSLFGWLELCVTGVSASTLLSSTDTTLTFPFSAVPPWSTFLLSSSSSFSPSPCNNKKNVNNSWFITVYERLYGKSTLKKSRSSTPGSSPAF